MKRACLTRWTGCGTVTNTSPRRFRHPVAIAESHCRRSGAMRERRTRNLEILRCAIAHQSSRAACRGMTMAEQQQEPPMPYVDGFIVAVPKKNLAAYARISRKAGKVWRE